MTVKIHIGDCRDVLRTMPAESVHCVITSPPYYGLRSYGVGIENGEIGLEETPQEYIDHLVECFREVRRVLRDDGCAFVNLGDSYASSGQSAMLGNASTLNGGAGLGKNDKVATMLSGRAPTPPGLKPKDLIGIPWRVALALQADGWWLRSDIIWAKGVSFCDTYSGSCMPESVRDRPTKSHEYIFLLTKSARYFWDQEAVKEANAPGSAGNRREFRGGGSYTDGNSFNNSAIKENRTPGNDGVQQGRNLRTVWTINPGSYPGSHFATFPPDLVKPMIAAGTSERGCCPECGASWVRVVEKESLKRNDLPKNHEHYRPGFYTDGKAGDPQSPGPGQAIVKSKTLGWKPTCTCNAGDPIHCTVLDPFMGAGTTLLQADRMGRDATGIELNETYARDLAYPRIAGDAPMFSDVELI
jgi:DNA modification methylase